MAEIHDYLTDVVAAIRDDRELRETFVRVLELGSSTQQVRVSRLLQELNEMDAPVEVLNFVKVLSNDQIAHTVLKMLAEA